MKTPIIVRFAGLLLAVQFAPSLAAAESFKWQAADGTVHYGQLPPTDGSAVQKVLLRDPPVNPAPSVRNLDPEGLKRPNQTAAASPEGRPQILAASEMSYTDRQKLKQIERDIERISSSSIGTVQDRQLQINALGRQRDAVYGTYGVQPGTTVTIQDNRIPPAPGADYYPIPPQTVVPPAAIQGQ